MGQKLLEINEEIQQSYKAATTGKLVGKIFGLNCKLSHKLILVDNRIYATKNKNKFKNDLTIA